MTTEHAHLADETLVRYWNDGDGSISWQAGLERELIERGYSPRLPNGRRAELKADGHAAAVERADRIDAAFRDIETGSAAGVGRVVARRFARLLELHGELVTSGELLELHGELVTLPGYAEGRWPLVDGMLSELERLHGAAVGREHSRRVQA